MIFIFLSVIVGIWCTISFSNNNCNSLFGKILSYIILIPMLSIGWFVFGFWIAMIIGIFGFFVPTENIIVEEPSPIYSIVDQTTTNGNFFLGSGSVQSDLSIYYVQEVDGGKSIKKIERLKVIIAESNTEKPNIKIIGERYKYKWVNLILLDINAFYDKTVLTVPVNTVIQEYNIDLK